MGILRRCAVGTLSPLVIAACLLGCGGTNTGGAELDAAAVNDAGRDAAGTSDAGHDAGSVTDAGRDAGVTDAGGDAGTDAGHDSGAGVVDSGVDSGTGVADAGSDAGSAVPDSGTGVQDAGMDSGTGVDAGMLVWSLEIWGYHVPDTWWTAGYAQSSVWDPGYSFPGTNPDISFGGTTDYDDDLLDRAPTQARWVRTQLGTVPMIDVDTAATGEPGTGNNIATCVITPTDVAAAKLDSALRTTTCTGLNLMTNGVTPDDATVTWRVAATYR